MANTQKLRWTDGGYRRDVLVDETGRILGATKGDYRSVEAVANGLKIGDYIDELSARSAVERAVRAAHPEGAKDA